MIAAAVWMRLLLSTWVASSIAVVRGLAAKRSQAAGFGDLLFGDESEREIGAIDDVQPPQLLIMSSPLERKVSYAQVVNFQAVGQVVHPLVDSGLGQPHGIAYHGASHSLYVADYGLKKIWRYGLEIRPCITGGGAACAGLEYEIVVKETQKAVVTDVMAIWVAVDEGGNLYFTEAEKSSVSRLSADVLQKMAAGYLQAENLAHVTFAEVAAGAPKDAIVQLYGATDSPLAMAPAGITMDGASNLYWASAGESGGAVARGSTQPRGGENNTMPAPIQIGGMHLPAPSGVALAACMTLVAGQDTTSVFGLCNGAPQTVVLADNFKIPRGIVWDGDNTAYIADFGASAVFSLPVGICRGGGVKRQAVSLRGVYGLAFIKLTDAGAY